MQKESGKATAAKTRQARIVSGAEAEVAQFMADFARAIRNGKIDDIMAFYAKDVIAFDMMPPLEFKGTNAYRNNWEVCFTDYFVFPVKFDFNELHIVASDDFAFTHSLSHMSGASHAGKKMESWLRNTTCIKKRNGKWAIVHEHNSVPLDMKTSKGLMNLPPEGVVH